MIILTDIFNNLILVNPLLITSVQSSVTVFGKRKNSLIRFSVDRSVEVIESIDQINIIIKDFNGRE
jgi:hypothetical protein